MKKIFNYILLGAVLVGATSCEKYLDINDNPNSFTSATPDLVLPQAIVGAAALTNSFSNALGDVSGARANAGGFGGFGDVVTYEWTNTNGTYNGLWTGTYDNANDFQYVINETSADPKLAYSTSIARIMKSLDFARLVDQFNDVPYSDALKGNQNLTPKFDKGGDVYKALVGELDLAIQTITEASANAETNSVPASADPMFKGDMEKWVKFANTLKLRLLIKMAGVPDLQGFATEQFGKFNTAAGFLTDDAIVNPGYVKTDRPNPTYNSLGYTTAGAISITSRIPTKWMYAFYDGNKITDTWRGKAVYRDFPSSRINQLGDESAGVPQAPSAGTSWSVLADKNATNAIGLTKGPSMGQVVMLASESYFLQAEAAERGYLTLPLTAKAAFEAGVTASFRYLFKDVSNTVAAGQDVAASVDAYKVANTLNYLVNFDLATTSAQRLEAIITQKYIAFNMIHNDEAYNEYRRTGFPRITEGSTDARLTFASLKSSATAPDKLPTRILYPQDEYNLNPANVPTGISQFTSRIFWDIN